jgi:hypothetical protein
MQLVLSVCILAATELGWRTFALTNFLEYQANSGPPSAESVSSRLAPYLTSRDAEKVYTTVQSQYVALTQQHELLIGLADSARQNTALALGAALLASLLSGLAIWLLRPVKASSS